MFEKMDEAYNCMLCSKRLRYSAKLKSVTEVAENNENMMLKRVHECKIAAAITSEKLLLNSEYEYMRLNQEEKKPSEEKRKELENGWKSLYRWNKKLSNNERRRIIQSDTEKFSAPKIWNQKYGRPK